MNKRRDPVLGDGKCEGRGHALFRGDEFDERVHPLTERLDRLRLFLQSVGESSELLSLVAVFGIEQGLATRHRDPAAWNHQYRRSGNAPVRRCPVTDLIGISAREYYAHVAEAPLPSIVVMQDVDGPDRGFGAFWGEVQSNVHKALGCAGVVTDGSVRDIDAWAPGFFVLAGSVMPSHAHVDVVEIGGTVSVAGMVVAANDLIHADRHGAVVIPHASVGKVMEAAASRQAREGAAQRRPQAWIFGQGSARRVLAHG